MNKDQKIFQIYDILNIFFREFIQNIYKIHQNLHNSHNRKQLCSFEKEKFYIKDFLYNQKSINEIFKNYEQLCNLNLYLTEKLLEISFLYKRSVKYIVFDHLTIHFHKITIKSKNMLQQN